jgi:UDP-glucose 4-epimerase
MNLQGAAGSLLSGGAGLTGSVFAQLLLDMHRHVGVMLVDRMSGGAVNVLTKHLEGATKVIALSLL